MTGYFSPLKHAVLFPLTRLLLVPWGKAEWGGKKSRKAGKILLDQSSYEFKKPTWVWQVFRDYSFSHGTIYGFLQRRSPLAGGKCICQDRSLKILPSPPRNSDVYLQGLFVVCFSPGSPLGQDLRKLHVCSLRVYHVRPMESTQASVAQNSGRTAISNTTSHCHQRSCQPQLDSSPLCPIFQVLPSKSPFTKLAVKLISVISWGLQRALVSQFFLSQCREELNESTVVDKK